VWQDEPMNEIIVGIVCVLVGAAFCFQGYLAMRIIIPIWGAFAGFVFGAGLIEAITNDGFLGTATGWFVGFGFALMFAAIAYLYYAVAVVIGMGAIGFTLGTGLMVALGVNWSWVIISVGVAVALLLAVVAIAMDVPMFILTVLSALAGAMTIVAGAMLIFGVLELEDFQEGGTTKAMDDGWGWYAMYILLAIIGMVAQMQATARQRESLRQAWAHGNSDAMVPG
jgi:hypothetical protein